MRGGEVSLSEIMRLGMEAISGYSFEMYCLTNLLDLD